MDVGFATIAPLAADGVDGDALDVDDERLITMKSVGGLSPKAFGSGMAPLFSSAFRLEKRLLYIRARQQMSHMRFFGNCVA